MKDQHWLLTDNMERAHKNYHSRWCGQGAHNYSEEEGGIIVQFPNGAVLIYCKFHGEEKMRWEQEKKDGARIITPDEFLEYSKVYEVVNG